MSRVEREGSVSHLGTSLGLGGTEPGVPGKG